MSRLNLDIFSSQGTGKKEKNQEKAPLIKTPVPETTTETTPKPAPKPDANEDTPPAESPRFVPVGFQAEHLRLLDEAVIALRRAGHWKASKSAIIRRLIERHAQELDNVWLRGKRE